LLSGVPERSWTLPLASRTHEVPGASGGSVHDVGAPSTARSLASADTPESSLPALGPGAAALAPQALDASRVPDQVALTRVFTELARQVYDECAMVQRINFLRAWGATAENMLIAGHMGIDDLPPISPSDCEPLLLTIMAMKKDINSENCDELQKSWLYYTRACRNTPEIRLSCMGNVYNAFDSYCLHSPMASNREDPSCEFDQLCQTALHHSEFLTSVLECNTWAHNSDRLM